MVGISLLIGALVGIPLALALVITRPVGLRPNKVVYGILNVAVNIIRSLPFIILLVAISPFTRVIAGTVMPEAKSSIILAVTTATVGLISATAMAGTIGGGGVGDLAISYGYQQFDSVAMLTTVIILIIVVQAIQSLGNTFARRARA